MTRIHLLALSLYITRTLNLSFTRRNPTALSSDSPNSLSPIPYGTVCACVNEMKRKRKRRGQVAKSPSNGVLAW